MNEIQVVKLYRRQSISQYCVHVGVVSVRATLFKSTSIFKWILPKFEATEYRFSRTTAYKETDLTFTGHVLHPPTMNISV